MIKQIRCVFLTFGQKHTKSGLEELGELFRRLGVKSSQVEVVVVDNTSAEHGEQKISDNVRLIAGDNRVWDFSGYEAGLAYFHKRQMLAEPSILVLANDTFHRNYGSEYLERFHKSFVQAGISAGAVVGWVDAYPKSVQLFGYQHRYWIRSSLIVGLSQQLSSLFPVSDFVLSRDIFDEDPVKFFSDNGDLSENFKTYNLAWLFGAEADDFKEKWHGQNRIREGEMSFAQAKARSIICEHLISLRAKVHGLRLLDVRTRREIEDSPF